MKASSYVIAYRTVFSLECMYSFFVFSFWSPGPHFLKFHALLGHPPLAVTCREYPCEAGFIQVVYRSLDQRRACYTTVLLIRQPSLVPLLKTNTKTWESPPVGQGSHSSITPPTPPTRHDVFNLARQSPHSLAMHSSTIRSNHIIRCSLM